MKRFTEHDTESREAAMQEFDLKKLEVARIYIRRMADGRNPANNQPVQNEVLDDPNVIRCLHFVEDILAAVTDNHGIVGKRYQREKEEFPLSVLQEYVYRHDKPVSHVLKQIDELLEGRSVKKPRAADVNQWLHAQGYLEKGVIEEGGKECWRITQAGKDAGLYEDRRGETGNEYVTILYSETGQAFLLSHIPEILEYKEEKKKDTTSAPVLEQDITY